MQAAFRAQKSLPSWSDSKGEITSAKKEPMYLILRQKEP